LRLHRTHLCLLVQLLQLLQQLLQLRRLLQSPEAHCTTPADVRRGAKAPCQAHSALTCTRRLRGLERLHGELLSKLLPEHPAALHELLSRLLGLKALLHRVGVSEQEPKRRMLQLRLGLLLLLLLLLHLLLELLELLELLLEHLVGALLLELLRLRQLEVPSNHAGAQPGSCGSSCPGEETA